MLVIPAIDIKEGRCVRLRQGKMSEETIFSDYPEEMAKKWFDAGARRLHLVDLDGAFQGRPVNLAVIRTDCGVRTCPGRAGWWDTGYDHDGRLF